MSWHLGLTNYLGYVKYKTHLLNEWQFKLEALITSILYYHLFDLDLTLDIVNVRTLTNILNGFRVIRIIGTYSVSHLIYCPLLSFPQCPVLTPFELNCSKHSLSAPWLPVPQIVSHWSDKVGHCPLKQYPLLPSQSSPFLRYASGGQAPDSPVHVSSRSHSLDESRQTMPRGFNCAKQGIIYLTNFETLNYLKISVQALWIVSAI